MSLDEAIQHAKEKGRGESRCAKEHRQLVRWLQELKRRRVKMAFKPRTWADGP